MTVALRLENQSPGLARERNQRLEAPTPERDESKYIRCGLFLGIVVYWCHAQKKPTAG